MAKKLVASERTRMNPETGEIEFEFEEVDDGKPELTPEQQAAAQQNFDNGDPSKAAERYKAVQGWATKVHQKNLELEQRLARLEAGVDAPRPQVKPPVELPTANDPGAPNLESVLSDPNALQQYVAEAVRSHLGLVGEYVRDQLAPFKPVLSAYKTHTELQTAVQRHEDFPYWQQEMLKVSQGLRDDQEMTLEELYYEARKLNPEKAMQIDSGQYKHGSAATPSEQATPAEQGETKPSTTFPQATAPGTNTQVPGTQAQVPAQAAPTYDPAAPPRQTEFPMGSTATAEELRTLAARHTTETGVADGSAPEPTKQGLNAAMEAAWSEVASG